jgi:hypothetical protein
VSAYAVGEWFVAGLFLVLSAMSMTLSVRLLRQGHIVTPRQLSRVARALRRRRREVPSDVVEHLMVVGRVQPAWLRLGLGVGTCVIGLSTGAAIVLGGDPGSANSMFFVTLGGSALALYFGAAIGAFVGLSCMQRESQDMDVRSVRQPLRDYCSPLAIALPIVAFLAHVLLLFALLLRLAPSLDGGSVARAIALPGMWTVIVAPPILFVPILATTIVIYRIGALSLLAIPQEIDARRRIDNAMRKAGIWQIVILQLLVASVVGVSQYLILATGAYLAYDYSPLYAAAMNGWYPIYLGYVLVMALTALALLILLRAGRLVKPVQRKQAGAVLAESVQAAK